MTTDAHPALIPFNSEKINDKYLVTNMLGCWDALDDDEFRQLNSLKVMEGGDLHDRLLKKGLIVDEDNLHQVIDGYRSTNSNLYSDTALHIAVLTKRCNLRCTYCHAEGGASNEDMSIETASRVLQYLFDVRSNNVTLEFQGGEAVLNWPVLKFLTENARKINTLGKNLIIVLVTNMMLLDDEKMKFLADNEVIICTSVDGPEDLHDHNRVDVGGRGSYKEVMAKIDLWQNKFGQRIHMMPTITRQSLDQPERIIDEYLRLGQGEIALRPVNKIGYASDNWDKVGYTAEEFNDFYDRAMAYIMKLNTSGTHLSERTARTVLTKVLLKKDPGFVDMMNPPGFGRSVMTYAPDGGCYPTDEARMLDDEIFCLGNINEKEYDDMLNNENLFFLLSAGCSDLWHYRSAFSPWLAANPVVNYAMEKNVIPKGDSRLEQVLIHQFRTVFAYLLDNDKYNEVFKRWTEGIPIE